MHSLRPHRDPPRQGADATHRQASGALPLLQGTQARAQRGASEEARDRATLGVPLLWPALHPGPSALRNKTYPLVVILDGLTWYDLGYPLLEVCARIKSRHGLAVVPSTVSAWLAEHRSLCAYRRLRAAGRKLFPARRILRSVKLYHQQVYSFVIHRAKLALLLEARANARFVGLARFLEEAPQLCPHELFRESARASQTKGSFDTTKAIVTTKENFATASAALVVPMVGDNHRRHETLQRFMLANDLVTVAVEVPIWITTAELTALAAEHGVTLPVEGGAITGHIAFLRLRNGAVHILDYKPDARTNRPIEQLRIYALALSRLAGSRSSTSSAPGSTRASTVSFPHARCSVGASARPRRRVSHTRSKVGQGRSVMRDGGHIRFVLAPGRDGGQRQPLDVVRHEQPA